MSTHHRPDPAADLPADTRVLVASNRGGQRDVFHRPTDDDPEAAACKREAHSWKPYTVAQARRRGFSRGCTGCFADPATKGGTPSEQTCGLCGAAIKPGMNVPRHIRRGECAEVDV